MFEIDTYNIEVWISHIFIFNLFSHLSKAYHKYDYAFNLNIHVNFFLYRNKILKERNQQ